MTDAFDDPPRLDADARSCRSTARPPVTFVRGEGTELWDSEGKRYLDFLGGLAVTSLGHAHPVVADAIADQAHTLLHVSNLFANDVSHGGGRDARPLLLGRRRPGRCSSPTPAPRPTSARIKLARKFGGPRPPRRRQRLRLVPRPHARHARRHRPAGQARAVPAAARGLPPRRVGRPRRARGGGRRDGGAPCCSSRCRARAACNPAPPELPRRRSASCATSGASADGRRGADRPRPHRASGSASSTHGVVPDVVTLAKALGNGMPIGACWARAEVAAAFEPGDHGSTYSGTRIATAAVSAVIDEMRRHRRARRWPRKQGGAPDRRCSSSSRGVDVVRGAGLLLGRRAGGRASTPRRCTRALLARGPGRQRRQRPTRALRPAAHVTDDEIDEAVGHRRRGARGGRDVTTAASFLEVDDLTVGRARDGARPGASADRRRSAARSTGTGVALIFEKPSNRTRQSMEMAVVAARRPPGLHARRRGRPRHARVGRGRRPHPGGLPRGHRGPGVRAPISSGWRPSASVPVVNLLSDRVPPAAGAGRRADDAAVPRRRSPARPWRTSATATTSPARWPRSSRDARHARALRLPAGLRARRGRAGADRRCSARRRSSCRTASRRGGARRRRRAHRHVGRRWGRRTTKTRARRRVRGLHGRRRR